jgi:hypothetical protein
LLAYALRRTLATIPLLLFVIVLTFALMRGIGGSPFRLEFGGVPLPLQLELTDHYNLDQPWFVELATYVRHIATLDFGPSLVERNLTVDSVIEQRFPVTGELALLAALWALPLHDVEYVKAARALGARRRHVALRHLLPNSAGVLVVAVFLELPAVILGEAFLSVLGRRGAAAGDVGETSPSSARSAATSPPSCWRARRSRSSPCARTSSRTASRTRSTRGGRSRPHGAGSSGGFAPSRRPANVRACLPVAARSRSCSRSRPRPCCSRSSRD